MALYEYYCESCHGQFEQITSSTDPEAGKCPKCQTKNTRKLISAFRVGGRGDLRESTMHGCHDCHVPLGSQQGGHGHGAESGGGSSHDDPSHGDGSDPSPGHSHDRSHDHDPSHDSGHGHS